MEILEILYLIIQIWQSQNPFSIIENYKGEGKRMVDEDDFCCPSILLVGSLGVRCILPMYFMTLSWHFFFIILSCLPIKRKERERERMVDKDKLWCDYCHNQDILGRYARNFMGNLKFWRELAAKEDTMSQNLGKHTKQQI